MEAKGTFFSGKYTLNLQGNLLCLDEPLVMGILNVTPDSFYDGGRHASEKDLLQYVGQLVESQVDIVDVGGYSSRPGAKEVSPSEERERVMSTVNLIKQHFPELRLSVDTFRSAIAKEALDAGVCMINDISGFQIESDLPKVVAEYQVPYVLMHMRGTPQSMMSDTSFKNVTGDLVDYFSRKIKILQDGGINDVIIDPGFGFSKTLDKNYELLRNLSYLNVLKNPILVGVSRKSMIYKKLDVLPEDALNGTSVLHAMAIRAGVSILRVHDVKEAKEVIQLQKELR